MTQPTSSNGSGDSHAPLFKAVVNYEEQYSIWPANRQNPSGWKDAGCTGTKEECLNYINQVWTDMRPLSLRLAEKQFVA
jgi:MbtH protein